MRPYRVRTGSARRWQARSRSVCAGLAGVSAENSRLLAAQLGFLQDASHQLRTPITIALGHAELLARSLVDQADQRDIEVVVGELNRLRSLSERLLVIAVSENPDFLRPEPLALDELALDLLQRWRPAAGRRWQLGQLDQATVPADPERIRLAMDALIENAIQHTGPGDVIQLSVRRRRRSPVASLVIEDRGAGIPQAQLTQIFDRFASESAPGGHRGTGLGLALVLAVARGHGGEIRVRSTLGAGTRFELRLPGVLPSGPAGSTASSPAQRPLADVTDIPARVSAPTTR